MFVSVKQIQVLRPQLVINREIALGYLKTVERKDFARKIKTLQNKVQPEQRTEPWYSAREVRVTASEAANCLLLDESSCREYVDYYNLKDFKLKPNNCANAYSDLNTYLVEKTHKFYLRKKGIIPAYMSTPATRWGTMYEEEAIRLYTLLTGDPVHEFGLITHSRLPWLGASPDGVTPKGVMLEIKCPKSRKVTGVPPFHYFVQCQIQLECCNLDMCHFLECEMEEFDTEEEWRISTAPKGLIVKRNETCIYPPKEEMTDDEFVAWAKNVINNECSQELPTDPMDQGDGEEWVLDPDADPMETTKVKPEKVVYSIVYYSIPDYTITNIPRMKNWFSINKPKFKAVHEKLMWLQKDPENFAEFKRSLKNPEDIVCMLN
jgi:hypothetical protein